MDDVEDLNKKMEEQTKKAILHVGIMNRKISELMVDYEDNDFELLQPLIIADVQQTHIKKLKVLLDETIKAIE